MKQHLMFSIDLLLDTRLAMIDQINPEVALRVIEQDMDKYKTRLNDNFDWLGLKPNQFRTAYAKRNKSVLKNARPTYFLFELNHIAEQLIHLQITEPHRVDEIEFHINTYPYHDLESYEIAGLVNAVAARLPEVVKCSGVYYTPEDLDPKWVKMSSYTGLFMYEGSAWLNHFYGANRNVSDLVLMPSIDIHIPALFEDEDKMSEAYAYENDHGERCNPLQGLQFMFAPYFHFELILPTYLSIIDLKTFTQREYSRQHNGSNAP